LVGSSMWFGIVAVSNYPSAVPQVLVHPEGGSPCAFGCMLLSNFFMRKGNRVSPISCCFLVLWGAIVRGGKVMGR